MLSVCHQELWRIMREFENKWTTALMLIKQYTPIYVLFLVQT